MNFDNMDDLIKQQNLELIKNNKCCFYPDEPIDLSSFLLIGRHQQVFKKGDSPTTKNYKIQGAYIPVSKKAFASFNLQIKSLKYLSYLFLGLSILSIPLIILTNYLSDNVPTWQIMMIFWFLPAGIFSFILEDLIIYYSKKIVNTNRLFLNHGVPNNNDKIYKALITEKKIAEYENSKKIVKLNF